MIAKIQDTTDRVHIQIIWYDEYCTFENFVSLCIPKPTLLKKHHFQSTGSD